MFLNSVTSMLNFLGDAAIMAVGWIFYLIGDAFWAFTITKKVFWLWALPATVGFFTEVGLNIRYRNLYINRGIGYKDEKGNVTKPFEALHATNVAIMAAWDLFVLSPLKIKIAMILIGGGIAVIWRFRGQIGTLLGRIPGGIRALINRMRKKPPTP